MALPRAAPGRPRPVEEAPGRVVPVEAAPARPPAQPPARARRTRRGACRPGSPRRTRAACGGRVAPWRRRGASRRRPCRGRPPAPRGAPRPRSRTGQGVPRGPWPPRWRRPRPPACCSPICSKQHDRTHQPAPAVARLLPLWVPPRLGLARARGARAPVGLPHRGHASPPRPGDHVMHYVTHGVVTGHRTWEPDGLPCATHLHDVVAISSRHTKTRMQGALLFEIYCGSQGSRLSIDDTLGSIKTILWRIN